MSVHLDAKTFLPMATTTITQSSSTHRDWAVCLVFFSLTPITIKFHTIFHDVIYPARNDLLTNHSQVFASAAITLLPFTASSLHVLDSAVWFESTTVNTKAIATIRRNCWHGKMLPYAHTTYARIFPSMTACILLVISTAA